MQENETIPNGQDFEAKDIFGGIPEDAQEDIETAEIDTSDFEIDINEDLPESDPDTEDPTLIEEIRENYEEAKNKSEDPEEVREIELSEKAQEIKKEFVSMINPKTVISFADFMLSRGGSAVMVRTKKDDWRLDPEEKEFLSQCLEVMIEEEGIEFWPAKVWLILAIIFFYGMKAQDNYMKFYSSQAQLIEDPEEAKARLKLEYDQKEVELYELERIADLEERKAKAEQRIKTARHFTEYGGDDKTTRITENGSSNEAKESLSERFPIDIYPPEKYHYVDGFIQLAKNGKPKLRTGGKQNGKQIYLHPITNRFIKKTEFKKLIEQGYMDEEGNQLKFIPGFPEDKQPDFDPVESVEDLNEDYTPYEEVN